MDEALVPSQTEVPELSVLVVMPDLFFRKRLRVQLQNSGYLVAEALSVERALARVATDPPDVVVLDTWTDGGMGVTLLEAIRSREELRHIPVLLFGNDTRRHIRERATELGALGPVPIDGTAAIDLWVTAALGC